MGPKFGLVKQWPRPKPSVKPIPGVLAMSRQGDASFFRGDGSSSSDIVCDLMRAKIEFAGSHGIMLSGMEPAGCNKNGTLKYRYQEWWLVYLDNKEKP